MHLDRIVESKIKEAMERGEFDNLSGKGKPLDLTAYFDMPEDVRMAYSVLQNAGMLPREVVLLKEIAELKQIESALAEEKKRLDVHKQIEKKQIEFSLMVERNHKKR
jgi:hypothetical protein